ncbi:MAG TPA: ChbG/HpnK family deacetylase [Beijerinckiaceae bacterium]|nr:ChbG/HpnK family deacetylase [Beijerinckiaceae bacterium]
MSSSDKTPGKSSGVLSWPTCSRRVNYFPQENNLMGFRFTLCADDFAVSPAVSRGILEVLEARRLSATSVMANRPHWRWAARELNQFAKVAEIGLHLNLTLGSPLSPMPKLAPGGEFPKLQRLLRASLQRKLPETELRGEIARQLDAFEEALGKPPDFVDGHQHIQVLPIIRDSLLAELTARKLAGRTWLRDSSDTLARIVARRVEIGKAVTVSGLGRGFARAAAGAGFAINDGFSGYSSFAPGRDYGADFRRYLVAPGVWHLVMCHPGRVDEGLAVSDPVTTTREQELDFLMSSRFADVLAAADATLASPDA